MEVDPASVVVAIDMNNAFDTLRRDLACAALRDTLPELAGLLGRLYCQDLQATWADEQGATHSFAIGTGLPQGCPLSPAAFALALERHVLQQLRAEFSGLITAYLDDVVAVLSGEDAERFLERAQQLEAAIGVSLSATKTRI